MRYYKPDRDLFHFTTQEGVVMGIYPREMEQSNLIVWNEIGMTVEEGMWLYFTSWV